MLAWSVICQSVDEPGVGMEVEDDGTVVCEDGAVPVSYTHLTLPTKRIV